MSSKRRSVASSERHKTVGFSVEKGQFSGGDSALMPTGYVRKVRNMLRRPNRWELRPQFTYDNLTGVYSLSKWYDATNSAWRLMSESSTAAYAKATSGETWGSTLGAPHGGISYDSTSYRGTWFSVGYTSTSSSTFNSMISYDGTSFKTTGAEEMAFVPFSLAPYAERMFYGGAQWQNYTPWGSGYSDKFYDAGTTWTLTSVTATSLVSGSATTYRITPTSTTAASLRTAIGTTALGTKNALGDCGIRFSVSLRGVSYSYAVPVSVQVRWGAEWSTARAYTAGNLVVPTTANNYIYRCSVAGTSHAVTEPTWPTTVGGTVTDNGITWICDGSDILSATDDTVDSASESSEWKSVTTLARIPRGAISAADADLCCDAVLTLFNAASPTITLAPLDFGYRDGKSVSDPSKRNFGTAIQYGYYTEAECLQPFASAESASDVVIVRQRDYLYWSEPLEPRRVLSQNYYRLTDSGPITAVRSLGGKLCVFSRNSVTAFGSTDDPDVPVLPEGEAKRGFGCLNPKSLDVFEDYGYFVGEDEVYRWRPGMDTPEPLCGDAMREEVMSKASATWCEAQSSPANRALLCVDPKNREVWVYTQKGKLYVYDIDDKAWSIHDAGGGSGVDTTGYQVCDMAYNPTTGNMYFAFSTAPAGTAGLARLDPTQSEALDSFSSSGTSTVYAELWPRPIELVAPRYDIRLERLRIHHKVTASQTGQTTTAYVSKDQGITFPVYNQVTLDPVSTGEYRPMSIPLQQTRATIQPRIQHAGKGGAACFNISQIEADVQVLSGEYERDHPVGVAAVLS